MLLFICYCCTLFWDYFIYDMIESEQPLCYMWKLNGIFKNILDGQDQ